MQAHQDEVVGEAGSLDQAQELTHVLAEDVDLGGDDGFGLIGRLDPVPAIVFVTAHSIHAPQAFDVAAVDFLLKPVERQRRADRAVAALSALSAEPAAAMCPTSWLQRRAPAPANQRLHIKMAGQSIAVADRGDSHVGGGKRISRAS